MDLAETEIYVINTDGSNLKQVTSLGGSNLSPTFLDDNRIIFSSNSKSNDGANHYNIYTINENGKNLEQVR